MGECVSIQRALTFLLLEVLFDLRIQLPNEILEFAHFYSFFFTQPPLAVFPPPLPH